MKQFESFRLDTANECLWRDGEPIAIPPKPFALLCYLVNHPGRLIAHDELLDAVWPDTFVQPQVLRTYVLELRKILGDTIGDPRYIQTQPKRGYRFVAEVTERPDASLSPVIHDAHNVEIAGRETELAQLESLMPAVHAGQRRIVFVSGESGIGKTALVDTFCRKVAASGQMNLARGQCVEGFSSAEEYYPVMEALGYLCASSAGETASRVLAQVAPAWLPSASRSSSTAGVARDRLPGDLCAALEEVAAKQPLILVLEDLHWADEATINLLSAIARRRAPASLMILATCGPGEREGPQSNSQLSMRLRQDLLIRQLCSEIALKPLRRTAVEQMLARKLQQESLPAGLAAFVHQHSEGNPLFVIAVVEHLIARGYLVRGEAEGGARWEQRGSLADGEAAVPAGLAQMIELEMRNLSTEQQQLLEAASIVGIAFPVWAVAAALERNAGATEEACDELTRRVYFVERAGQDELPDGTQSPFYVFVHGLYREVIYRRQPGNRRAAGHLRVARRLSELFAGRESSVARELAMHHEAAADWGGAIQALRSAASHALDRSAPGQAADLLESALRLAGRLNEEERMATARDLSEILQRARDAEMASGSEAKGA